MEKIASSAYSDSKPHYELLDALRGVAALMVIWYHVFEGFATSPADQTFNHGYLAVDFFFILSGFVISYAYDDRWGRSMTIGNFIKRRLIRLHPMVVLGAVLGVASFCAQGRVMWDGTQVSPVAVVVAFVLTLFLFPAAPGGMPEVRGNGEMYPLNGPSWSLFFEYIGNLLYCLFIRRLSVKYLALLVALAGAGLAWFALSSLSPWHNLGAGWSLGEWSPLGGFLRLLFAFSMGILLSRVFRPMRVRGAFWICAASIVVLLYIPYVGDTKAPSLRSGVSDLVCVVLIFPLLVYLGASGKATDRRTSKICKFLGDISYPLYIVHYPSMYLFYAYVWKDGLSFSEVWPITVGLFVGNIALAYLCLKLYDEPVRKWLTHRFLSKTKRN